MDTVSHIAIGLGLAGLSQLDPLVAEHSITATAVFIGIMLGSQAPDVDTILKLKSNEAYVRNHRGFSHSIPMLLVWTVVITALLSWSMPASNWQHTFAWTGFAVVLHVFTDLFNTYGTQAVRPFSEEWISWNIISLFDPFIFTTHLVAVTLWGFNILSPILIFPVLYFVLIGYFVWRTLEHRRILRRMPQLDPEYNDGERYTIIPTVAWSNWNVVKKQLDGAFRVGHLRRSGLIWNETARCDSHPAVEASKSQSAVKTFLYFTRYGCASIQPTGYGYVVRWVDVRYRHRKQYPFVALVMMNSNFEPLDTYIGWISEKQMKHQYGLE
ncbi:metal-dependent hydrolase [Paenibacillus sp. ACRRX]|uniref:metal-dependent hydrolase n=1 Tax=Paenibacillus sp. ACRRX TaxID=2918206 RepID=UPI001EF4C5C1|nr:metal-dependent hydrolase [Paenibacillus sp. ACRRX]MCG7410433.1 metal-dependent hydrolase [Paenibacillus sp. ACRRX]